MMSQRCTWVCSLLAGVLITSVAGNVEADTLTTGGSFPASAEVIAAIPDQATFGDDANTSLAQTFSVSNAFEAVSIWVEYENDSNSNVAWNMAVQIFEVADVHASDIVAGTTVYSNAFEFPPVGGADTVAQILLDTPVPLATSAGTAGYAIQFTEAAGGDFNPGWEWLRTGSSAGNVYPGGDAYENGSQKSPLRDFTLAIAGFPQPTNIVFTQTSPALTSSTNGTDLGEFVTEPQPSLAWAYSLVTGSGDTDNDSFDISGDRLLTATNLAGLGGSTLSFRAESALGGKSTQEIFQVMVKTDSDTDGLPDDWELGWSPGNLSALNGDGVADADSDGLTDLEEFMLFFQDDLNLNPLSDDTDGDTLLDSDEINGTGPRPPTNPTLADTDGDELSDTVETNTGIFVGAGDTGTDPTDGDTDGDSLGDAMEDGTGMYVSTNAPGTSPLTPDSDGDGLTDSEEIDVNLATDPTDWDSDDDTAGDGLEEYSFSNPKDGGSTPSFGWPVAKQTFNFTNHLGVTVDTLLADVFASDTWIELLRGEQLTLAFDIVGNTNNVSDELDVRFGFGGEPVGHAFEHVGYLNPATDVGPPEGTTAVIRYRNDADNYGSTVNNVIMASTEKVPANGGITGTSTVNSISYSLIRSDLGYSTVLMWDDVLLEATITPADYWGHPLWDRWHIRLNHSEGTYDVTNIRVIYGNATEPYIRPIALSDLTPGPGPSLSFSYPTDLGSTGYELQGTSDLTDPNPAAWTTLLSGIPVGGATSTLSTVEVPGGDLSDAHRNYRIVFP